MKNWILLGAAALLLAACAGQTKLESDLGVKGAPDWVNKGTAYVSNDGGRLFAVVGEGPAMHARLYTRRAAAVTFTDLFETSLLALDNAPHRNAFVF